ncbi:MAG: 1-(5-phosphoribosyl)-5-[(5-phosphoribosylamino)methylideneamino]imidazole-4-carboxamide isomerase [Candidatus Bathyarchaeia archaeon]
MYVIPSIDILGGKCVKLVRGRPGSGTVVSGDPVSIAEGWEEEGAKVLHVVDLDGALRGEMKNQSIVTRILDRVSIPVEVGGGMRNIEDVSDILDAGARWAILGTVAVENQQIVQAICGTLDPDRIILALDSRGGGVLSRGWTTRHEISPVEMAKRYQKLGTAAYLYTAVEVEGTGKSVDAHSARELVSSTRIPIIYSGGISSVADLVNLSSIGVHGVVVGSSLYRGEFTLKEAEEAVENAIG